MTLGPDAIIATVTSRRVRTIVAGVVSGGVVAAVLLFVPPPAPVIRLIARATAVPLLNGSAPDEGRISRSAKRFLRMYVQCGIAAHLGNAVATRGASDEVKLARLMSAARQSIQYPVGAPDDWPALIAGVGYCDQINGVVAMMAARHFEKAELFGLLEGDVSVHTVGRVWSEQRREWLYFDALFGKPVIYTRDGRGRVAFVDVRDEGPVLSRPAAAPEIYRLSGTPFAPFSPSFGGILLARLFPEERAPFRTPPAVLLGQPTEFKSNEEAFRHIAKTYVAVRMDDLFRERDRNAYRAIADDPVAATDSRATALAAVARGFAE
jgi:hypothetical protein